MEAVTLTVYLAVVAKTYRDTNLSLKKKGKTPLYCQPETISLNHDTVTDIIETKAEMTTQSGTDSRFSFNKHYFAGRLEGNIPLHNSFSAE